MHTDENGQVEMCHRASRPHFLSKTIDFSGESKGNAFEYKYLYVFQRPQLKFQQFRDKIAHFSQENT